MGHVTLMRKLVGGHHSNEAECRSLCSSHRLCIAYYYTSGTWCMLLNRTMGFAFPTTGVYRSCIVKGYSSRTHTIGNGATAAWSGLRRLSSSGAGQALPGRGLMEAGAGTGQGGADGGGGDDDESLLRMAREAGAFGPAADAWAGRRLEEWAEDGTGRRQRLRHGRKHMG